MKFAKVDAWSARAVRRTNVTQINDSFSSNGDLAAERQVGWLCKQRNWICEANVGQATKGTRGIPWHQQPTKDVADHERPGEAVNRR